MPDKRTEEGHTLIKTHETENTPSGDTPAVNGSPLPGSDATRRGVPKCDGIYIQGFLEGVKLYYAVDTGASTTIVSTSLYKRIPEDHQPELRPARPHTVADGRPLEVLGRGKFNLQLGSLHLDAELTVANISDDVLLGADIIQNGIKGPADLILSEERMVLHETSIPLMLLGIPEKIRKAYAADHYVIPPLTEMILDVYVDRSYHETSDKTLMIEPTSQVNETLRLIMANSLINLTDNTTVKIRVMNPYETPASIKQDMVMGYAFQVQEPFQSLLPTETDTETETYCTRQIPGISYSDVTPCEEKLTQQSPLTVPEHLQDMFNETIVDKEAAEIDAVKNLLNEFKDTFSKNDHDLGRTTLGEHCIDTGDALPVRQPPRRTPRAFEGEDQRALEKLQKQGTVRPSTSPWASPIVLVRKKDGSARPCVDYRRLNQLTKKDAFPLPRTEDCLDAVAGAKWFSTLDITSAYNQIPVRESDIPKTAFVTKHGLFENTTMPFGLCNAPATFQRVMEMALRGLQWSSCLIYLDDVIIFGQDFTEHMNRLHAVLSRIQDAGLKLKPSKCHFLQPEVAFLGHIISREGVLPNPANIEKLTNWPRPSTVTEVRGILGLGSYYRRFVKDFSKLVHPLTQLTKKDEPFNWTTDCETAFQQLKKVLVGPEIMGYPRGDCTYILDTDACDVSIGAVLSQLQEGRERVIAYSSRTLNKAERNYCVTDKELLAVKNFIEHHKHHLLGRAFVVRTDHQAIKWLFSLKDPKARIARWIEILSAYNFTVEYRPGKQHGNADALSRCPNPRECICPAEQDISMLRCGPCGKCTKRSEDMQSKLLVPDTPNTINNVRQSAVSATKKIWDKIMSFMLTTLVLMTGLIPLTEETLSSQSPSKHSAQENQGTHDSSLTEGILQDDGRTRPKAEKNLPWWYPAFVQPETKLNRGCRKVQTRSSTRYNNQQPVMPPAVPASRNLPPKTTVSKNKTRHKPEWASNYSMASLRKKQEDDPDLAPILKWKETGSRPYGTRVCATSPATRHYWNSWDLLEFHDGVLFRRFARQDGTGCHLQYLVPRSMRNEVFQQMHSSLMSGHLGKRKTREKTLQRFYWFGVRDDVNLWVKRCDSCGGNKPPTKTPRAPLGDMRVGAPMDRLATDILGPFPTSSRGNKYVLIVTDYFTNWVEILAVPDQTAITCAERILDEVISRFGCPLDLHSDQGPNYRSAIFAELCRLLEIRKTRTSARNPRCNGKVERFNKTLVRMIRAYLKGQQREWDRHLGCLAAAYRASPHEATGMTPNLLMMGREVRLPAEVMFGSTTQEGEITSYGEYVDKLRSRMQHAHDIARKHTEAAGIRQKDYYDGKTFFHKFTPGDYVWYLAERRKVGENPKLYLPYEGPYLVVKKQSDLNYLIQCEPKGEPRLVHHNKLKPYEGVTTYRWAKAALARAEKGKYLPEEEESDDD